MSLLLNPFTQQAFIDGAEVPYPPSPAHIWNGDGWVVPQAEETQEEVPSSITRFQARSQLHISGLLDAANAAIAEADPLVQIAWSDAQVFNRDSPNIAAISEALGLSSGEVDDLFIAAAKITA